VVSPITNDKILPQSNDRNTTAAGKKSSGGQNSAASSAAARPTDDSVELSNASRLSNREASATRNGGNINSPAEARELVARISAQMESDGAQAIKIHGQLESGITTTLLDASAA